jgi:voltage-gated potassium channel
VGQLNDGVGTEQGWLQWSSNRSRMQMSMAGTRQEAVERGFQRPLLVAAVLSIPTTILEFSSVVEPWPLIGHVLNWLIWFAFLAELITMLSVVPERGRYLLTHPVDLAIVVLTPPFLTSTIQSIRVLRLLRVFRLLRLKPLAEMVFSMDGIRAAAGLAALTVVVGGAGYAAEENITFGNGLYWAVTTMATVGYGDISPHKTEGKIIAVVVMLVGIGTATLLIGAVAERFLAGPVEEVETTEGDILEQVRDISTRLARLERALQTRSQSS